MALQPGEEKGQLVKDTKVGWKIEPGDFERNYTPEVESDLKETYLLYEIHWGKSHKTWKHSCRNDGNHHAEIKFFEEVCKEIKDRKNKPCSITWYLSWSPCHECSQSIIKFLEKHPKVTLDIRASRLFKYYEEQNNTGLRDLAGYGISISIMHPGDYSYCWRTFVTHQKKKDEGYMQKKKDEGYKRFFEKIHDWNEKLFSVLNSGYSTNGHRLVLAENQ